MKKLLSSSLAAVLIAVSLFSAGVSAAQSTKTETLLKKLDQAGEVSVTLSGGEAALFGVIPVKTSNSIYIKGNKVAYEYGAGFLKARAILKDGSVYAFLPFLPFICLKCDGSVFGSADVWGLIQATARVTLGVLRFVKSYNETLDGKTYYVEEFDDRALVTSKFYYEGDELKLLNVVDAGSGSVQNTYFENISFAVDDGEFDVPASAIDASFLLKIIASLAAAA